MKIYTLLSTAKKKEDIVFARLMTLLANHMLAGRLATFALYKQDRGAAQNQIVAEFMGWA